MARRLLLLLLAATALASHHHESEWCNAKRHACERACNGDDAVFRCDDAGGARSWSCACDGVRFGGSELKEAVAMVPEAAWVSAPNAALPDAPLPIDRAPLHIDRWFGDEQQDLEQADEVAACLLFAAPFAAAGLAAALAAGLGLAVARARCRARCAACRGTGAMAVPVDKHAGLDDVEEGEARPLVKGGGKGADG